MKDQALGSVKNVESSAKSKRKLRVAVASDGRFHLLDLARELDALDVDVRFYSYVPRRRAWKFGLPKRCHVALFPYMFPLVGAQRKLPRVLPRLVERLMYWSLDLLVILHMRRCDAFVCMSGMYLLAPRFAKWRFGATIFLHRGSQHITAQDQILEDRIPEERPTPLTIRRELAGYELADVVVIPSKHVAESFAQWPSVSSKLCRIPYGVDLSEFPARSKTTIPRAPTIIFVGHWSYRKGADVLTEALQMLEDFHFIHVGAIRGCPFPNDPRFVHHDPVPQWQLKHFYAKSDVFVLASREEGLAVVQVQALASGLPVVCTDRTGGGDLAERRGFRQRVRVVPAGNVSALRDAIAEALDDVRLQREPPPLTDAERETLSWREYALHHLHAIENF